MNKNSLHIQNDSGKAKKKCEFIKNLEFSVEIFDIICGSLATQHARWHKSITLQEVEPSLRVTLEGPWELQLLRKQSDFAFLKALRGLEIALFHEISSSDTYMGAPMQNLGLAQTFSLLHVWS